MLNFHKSPQSANVLDTTKANWSLRVMIDNVHENAMELRRDTQREEEIKNIKSAWETMEPGRSAKVLLRLLYLFFLSKTTVKIS